MTGVQRVLFRSWIGLDMGRSAIVIRLSSTKDRESRGTVDPVSNSTLAISSLSPRRIIMVTTGTVPLLGIVICSEDLTFRW